MPTYKAIPLAAALLAATLLAPGHGAVAAGDPFEELKGDWKGGGTVVPSSGEQKTVACKVTYTVKGKTLTQHLRCAGEDYNINSTAKMTDKSGKIRGSWTEVTYDANGGITGTVRDDTVHAKISGDKFSSRMSIEICRRWAYHQHRAAQREDRHLSPGREPRVPPLDDPQHHTRPG